MSSPTDEEASQTVKRSKSSDDKHDEPQQPQWTSSVSVNFGEAPGWSTKPKAETAEIPSWLSKGSSAFGPVATFGQTSAAFGQTSTFGSQGSTFGSEAKSFGQAATFGSLSGESVFGSSLNNNKKKDAKKEDESSEGKSFIFNRKKCPN